MFIRGSPTSPNSLAGSIVRSRPKTHLSASASWATLWPNQKSGPRPTMAQLKTRPSRCSRASWAFPRASATPEKPRIRRQVLFTSLYGADPIPLGKEIQKRKHWKQPVLETAPPRCRPSQGCGHWEWRQLPQWANHILVRENTGVVWTCSEEPKEPPMSHMRQAYLPMIQIQSSTKQTHTRAGSKELATTVPSFNAFFWTNQLHKENSCPQLAKHFHRSPSLNSPSSGSTPCSTRAPNTCGGVSGVTGITATPGGFTFCSLQALHDPCIVQTPMWPMWPMWPMCILRVCWCLYARCSKSKSISQRTSLSQQEPRKMHKKHGAIFGRQCETWSHRSYENGQRFCPAGELVCLCLLALLRCSARKSADRCRFKWCLPWDCCLCDPWPLAIRPILLSCWSPSCSEASGAAEPNLTWLLVSTYFILRSQCGSSS